MGGQLDAGAVRGALSLWNMPKWLGMPNVFGAIKIAIVLLAAVTLSGSTQGHAIGSTIAPATHNEIESLTALVTPIIANAPSSFADPQTMPLLTKAAQAGVVDAQACLACRLVFGPNRETTASEGVAWMEKAAIQGHVKACGLLGWCLWAGHGVDQDYAAAVVWLTKAVDAGDTDAMVPLGFCRETGQGIKRDEAEGFKLYRRAAREGNMLAQWQTGRCYATGMGTEKNVREAFRWFSAAAKAGHEQSKYMVAVSYDHGIGVNRDTPAAVRWYRELAEAGNLASQVRMAELCFRGQGVVRDYKQAAVWLERAAGQGDARSQHLLAVIYRDGLTGSPNEVLAYAWASLAAAQGIDDARAIVDDLERQMPRTQVAEAQQLATSFTPRLEKSESPGDAAAAQDQRDPYASGSGFFVSADGVFVTSHHVIKDATRIKIKSADGLFDATVIRVDAANDLAVLKVSGTFSTLVVRGSGGLKLADRVATVGFPNPDLQGLSAKYSSGEVAALAGIADDPRYLQISVPIQPGNSGGPLVDSQGYVVGVVAARLSRRHAVDVSGAIPENVNYAIKGSILLNVLESIEGLPAANAGLSPSAPATATEVARVAEAACGMVLVER